MPLDHFIPQVHLRNFYSPILGSRMFALRKADMKAFTPDSYSICRVPDGSSNPYISESRAIEEFLKGIEPRYNNAIENVAEREIELETIYVLAGFIAYVHSCSPAGMRIHSTPLRRVIEESGRLLDRKGIISAPPPELGGTSFTELIERGVIEIKVDLKYPQAMGISSILQRTNTFGNFRWEILINEWADSPFFTSDFPIAVESTNDRRITNRIVPLSPTLAVRLHPNLTYDRSSQDFSFPGFRRIIRRLDRREVAKVNTLLVRSAESLVFFRDNHEWIEPFVRKNSQYRIEALTNRLPNGNGALLISNLCICNHKPA